MKRNLPKDPRGGHVRLYWELMDCPAWRALSHADVRVYLAMRRKLGKTNNGDINATLTEMRHAGISSSSTLSIALHRLEALGFIEKTRQGGIANGGKVCSLFRFTDEVTYDIAKAGVKSGPATHEWRGFESIAKARAAIRGLGSKKSKLRPSNRTDSPVEPDKRFADSTVEHEVDSSIRKSNRTKVDGLALQPA
jgi:hypothetical protein